MYMYIHVLNYPYRNWRQHLRSVKDSNHQVELYHTLNILLEEPDKDTFTNQMEAFIRLWETTESDFIKYFKTYYASRAGYFTNTVVPTIRMHMYVYVTAMHYTCTKESGFDVELL